MLNSLIPRCLLALYLLLCSCHEQVEKKHDKLKSESSSKVAGEKTVIIPPEVVKRWKAVRIAVIDKTRGTENIYTIPVGTTFKIPDSKLVITVESFLPAFTMEGATITTSSNELINPSTKVKITEKGSPVFQGWLFSKFPNTHAVSHPKFGFSLINVIETK